MADSSPDTDELLRQVETGDRGAEDQLFARHRDRLRRMVAVRMAPRLSRRIDPSDVVQEALASASAQLPAYLRNRPLPFYPWLRQITWHVLVDSYRTHVVAEKRTLHSERDLAFPDHSSVLLVERIVGHDPSPSDELLREELESRVHAAIAQLGPRDREILVMRDLEQMHVGEIAAVLRISESAVKMRRLRAIRRLRKLLDA
ncbi:MAG: sigma-70 family RNA polymerase sigma factor [Planctomycetes bacterium]|nr:sigma-70 family RNA polymerase sigma factor [Planctomycetota bacterium]